MAEFFEIRQVKQYPSTTGIWTDKAPFSVKPIHGPRDFLNYVGISILGRSYFFRHHTVLTASTIAGAKNIIRYLSI